MAVIMDNGVLPASKDCAAEVIYEGKVYTYGSSGRMTVATDVSATAYLLLLFALLIRQMVMLRLWQQEKVILAMLEVLVLPWE